MIEKKKFVKKRPNLNMIRYRQYTKLSQMYPKRKDLREKANFYFKKALHLSFDDLAYC